jgi:lipoprotein signal peptidase
MLFTMNKRAFMPFALALVLFVLDFVTKWMALERGKFWANPGIVGGQLGSLDPQSLLIGLGLLASLIMLAYWTLQVFLSAKLRLLKFALSVMFSGIMANMWDKAYRGWTVDWIFWRLFSWEFALNLADIFIFVGAVFIIYCLFKYEKQLWHSGEGRQKLWLAPDEQISFALKIVSLMLTVLGILGLFSYVFLKQSLMNYSFAAAQQIAFQYLIILSSFLVLISVIVFWISIWISQKFVGPLHAFERYLRQIKAGHSEEFKLRDGDMLQKLEEIAKIVPKLLLIIFPSTVFAYPQYISLQYTSCLTCHYNPQGNGPLNDYGRAVGATAIAGRFLEPGSKTEEQLVRESAFPGIDPTKNTWIRPMLGYRGLALDNSAFRGESNRQWINMQLDGSVTLQGGERNQYIANFTYGTQPLNRRQDLQNLKKSKGYSREHYLGWRPVPKFGVYAGKMDKAFGLRIPDHNLSARRATRAAQFDQVHGVMLHYVGEAVEFSVHGYVGDLNEEEENQDKGFSGILEWGIFPNHRLGFSAMKNRMGDTDSTVVALHDRMAMGRGHSLMTEAGIIRTEDVRTRGLFYGTYGLLQTHLMLARGLWFQGTFDYYQRTMDEKDQLFKVGPGIQWFPRQKVELRMDVYNRRQFSETTANADSWEALMQVHLWL